MARVTFTQQNPEDALDGNGIDDTFQNFEGESTSLDELNFRDRGLDARAAQELVCTLPVAPIVRIARGVVTLTASFATLDIGGGAATFETADFAILADDIVEAYCSMQFSMLIGHAQVAGIQNNTHLVARIDYSIDAGVTWETVATPANTAHNEQQYGGVGQNNSAASGPHAEYYGNHGSMELFDVVALGSAEDIRFRVVVKDISASGPYTMYLDETSFWVLILRKAD